MADRLRVVLDTNVVLVAISSRSRHHWIFRSLLEDRFELLLSNDLLSEYEEVIGEKLGPEVASNVVRTLLMLPNVSRVEPYFSWRLIHADPDDDKLVDCAVAANATCIVSHDRHLDTLATIDFPSVRVVDVDGFEALLAARDDDRA